MGLNRTALRVATVMALANGFEDPWPTMARARVFDSRFDPLQIVDMSDVMPIITVCTDDDKGDSLSQNNGGPPFEQSVTLVIEITIGMVGEIDGEKYVGLPQTEPELEAMLDLFERQVKAVMVNPTNVWSIEFQKHARRITDWNSARFVEAEGNVRLAARKMSATVMLQLEELTDIVFAGASPAPTPAIPAPLGPLLDMIIASGSPFAASATAMQELLLDAGASSPITLEPLERIRPREAHDIQTNGAGTRKGPRGEGVAEIELPQG